MVFDIFLIKFLLNCFFLFLGAREVIQVRRSQIKFECDHYDLEVIDYSKPCNLTLNRQVITLLSSLGVQDIAFLHIQNEARLRATMALLKCREAISLLDKVRFFEFEKITNSGSKFKLKSLGWIFDPLDSSLEYVIYLPRSDDTDRIVRPG